MVDVGAAAIDDETAFKVTDGTVEVVSEGHWKLFTPSSSSSAVGSNRDSVVVFCSRRE